MFGPSPHFGDFFANFPSLTAAHTRLFLCVLCRAVSARPY